MSMISGPFARPTSVSDPGLGRRVMFLAVVFVLGLVVIGLIYLAGQPVQTTVAVAPPVDAASNKTPADAPADTVPPASVGEPYIAPAGRSPLPMPGEGVAPPMPARRLIDQAQYEAQPPEPSTLPAPDGPVPWTEAHKYLGQTITVKGTIVDTNNIGQICFLNYDPDWQDKFYIALFKEAFDLLPDPPEQHYLNMTLLVTGKVTLHRDRPQIEVHDVSQIEVVE